MDIANIVVERLNRKNTKRFYAIKIYVGLFSVIHIYDCNLVALGWFPLPSHRWDDENEITPFKLNVSFIPLFWLFFCFYYISPSRTEQLWTVLGVLLSFDIAFFRFFLYSFNFYLVWVLVSTFFHFHHFARPQCT